MKKSNLLIAVLVLFSSSIFAQSNQKTTSVQFSFNYPLGTNGFKSYQNTNNVSLNMLIGFNGGLQGVELAGLGNINNGDIKGVQASGLMNVVNGNVNGGQVSGMFNINTGSAKGLQSAGLFNFNKGNFDNIQLAGLFNSNYGNANGLQIAGLFNSNLNLPSQESTKLIQLSGLINQNAGVTKGLQISGILNVAVDSLNGFQGGFINLASSVKGVQIGFINICTKKSDVIPIGFINIVKGGLYELELNAGDVLYANVSFKMGVEKFYTIFKTGFSVYNGETVYNHGIGFGRYFDVNEKSKIAVDLTTNNISKYPLYSTSLDMLNKIDINYKYKITNNFSVFAGPSYNTYITGYNSENKDGILNVPYTFAKSVRTNVTVYNWIGANLGISVKF